MTAACFGQMVWRRLLVLLLSGGALTGCAPNPAQVEALAADLSVTPEVWQAAGRTFSYRGQRVFYRTGGAGSPVVLLHGYPMSSWEWHRVWDGLSARHTVVAPDFLGYGFSSKPESYPYAVADHAAMLEALLASLGVDDVRLVAHDVGFLVAAELVSRAQAGTLGFDIRSVVLLNGTLLSAERRPSFAQALLGGVFGGLVNDLASEASFTDNLVALTSPDAPDLRREFAASWALLNHPGSSRIIHKLLHTVRDRRANEVRWAADLCASPVPLRFVVGPDDPSAARSLPESFGAGCERAFSSLELPSIGHFPHLEAPEKTLKAILSWREGGY